MKPQYKLWTMGSGKASLVGNILYVLSHQQGNAVCDSTEVYQKLHVWYFPGLCPLCLADSNLYFFHL